MEKHTGWIIKLFVPDGLDTLDLRSFIKAGADDVGLHHGEYLAKYEPTDNMADIFGKGEIK